MADNKPSFLGSFADGAWGYIKGALVGAAIGIAAGAAIGAVLGLLTGGVALAGAAALIGAKVGGSIMATIGSISGAATEVVKGREVGQPTVQDMANMAKISFVRGVGVGQQMQQAQAAEQNVHRQRELERRAQLASQQSQALH